ncbi:sugar phosphate nucleotidyltransferase [Paenibacillus qinlingensis]|uniref:Glucose-1-phosphate thymidylyltransferase n=1 Tax=Paenibacillus qinlingensis TaxID=1837343 RepID=A0ABU1NUI6_9BACL|nr:sugar phosphate nucleotidyltransferase [Paenibacillus qinlingensis]MDR6551139.1 glucose-1-phosphate thymidylyltransferase [Paenibacillus qinlingensis]
MKGLILCAGKGTRLQPFSNIKPKGLLPVANKPLIYYGIEKLVELGINEIGIVIRPNLHTMFMEEVGNGERWDVNITYIFQVNPLGISDAVKFSESFIDNEPFILLLGDNLITQDLHELCHAITQDNHDAAILLRKVANPKAFGIAEVNKDRIIGLEEKPSEPKSDLAVLGSYAFKSSIFKAVHAIQPSARGEYEITDAIQWLIHQQYSVTYQMTAKNFSDVGTMEGWLEANRWMLQLMDDEGLLPSPIEHHPGNTFIPPVCIDPSAELINCVIGPYVTIGPNVRLESCTLENSILLEYAILNPNHYPMTNSIISPQSVFVQKDGGTGK